MSKSVLDVSLVRSLAECEAVIERSRVAFVEAGAALRDILGHRLYREKGHHTFEDYCRVRWGFSRAEAYRKMDAANVSRLVSPIGDIAPPANEAQARELVPLLRTDPERIPKVWQQVREAKGDAVTAGDVREAVRNLRGGLPAPSRPPRTAPPLEVEEDDPLAAKTSEDIAATVGRLLTMGSTFILAPNGRTVWHEPAPDVMQSLLDMTTPDAPQGRNIAVVVGAGRCAEAAGLSVHRARHGAVARPKYGGGCTASGRAARRTRKPAGARDGARWAGKSHGGCAEAVADTVDGETWTMAPRVDYRKVEATVREWFPGVEFATITIKVHAGQVREVRVQESATLLDDGPGGGPESGKTERRPAPRR